ncbi:TY-Chap domain-containing protein [Pseudarthrobacter sp. L19]|uniref:TY-Chap domain-containing protein n=1 Tax=Pseudarthrobacter sp. L19 TaxID=3423951 RepID=UPI003D7BBC19
MIAILHKKEAASNPVRFTTDIPKVLAALGAPVDVDIAVEMLRSMFMFKESLHRVLQQEGVAGEVIASPLDVLSLLYVTGIQRGVTPDYELALGMMPVSSITSLREHIGDRYSYQKTAGILAVIESTSQAIRDGDVAGISYSEYNEIAVAISRDLQDVTPPNVGSWPVPADDLRRRLGRGFWDAALDSAGLQLTSGGYRFSAADFAEAARAFMSSYEEFGSPKEVSSYDSWVIAETAAGRERPSAIAIRRHFGTWESVIRMSVPSEIEDEFDGIVDAYRAENAREESWARAGELISEVLANMSPGSFLSIQYAYDADNLTPYAQAVPDADGVWSEIVSEQFLPAEQWPINTGYLAGNGWSAPTKTFPNWHKDGISPVDAGHEILDGLSGGWGCDDPAKFRWHTGQFPAGPGPDGGVTLEDALNGAVQSLENAA